MNLDFWNNPMVVTALRLKFRRGSPGLYCAGVLLIFLLIGAIENANSANFSMPFGRAYLLTIFGCLFALCGFRSLSSVSSSINAEVSNRTLEFQKLVALSPRQIMLGKVIGEPVQSYFYAISCIPLAVLCWFLGGASGAVVFWFYVNLFTFTFMCGALGTLHTLQEPPQGNRQAKASSGRGWIVVIPIMLIPNIIANGVQILANGWVAAPLGLFTPVNALMYLYEGNAWKATIPLWNFEPPALLLAPIAQLSAAWLALAAMSRRLEKPLRPLLSKPAAYLLLLAVELLVAAVAMHERRANAQGSSVIWIFGAIHLVAAIFLLTCATPSHEMLRMWIWRRKTQAATLGGLLCKDRSPTVLMPIVFSGVAALVAVVGLALPAILEPNALGPRLPAAEVAKMLAITSLVLITYGWLMQFTAALMENTGIVAAWATMLVISIFPVLAVGVIFYWEGNRPANPEGAPSVLYTMSPLGYWMTRFHTAPLGVVGQAPWLAGVHLLLAFCCARGMSGWLRRQRLRVATKLEQMNVAS